MSAFSLFDVPIVHFVRSSHSLLLETPSRDSARVVRGSHGLISARVDAPVGRPDQPELEQLMEQYVNGSAAAFDELYRRIAPRMLSYLLRLTRSRDRAEDLLQVTFAKVHRARATYINGAPVMPWVLAIARRSFLDERRASRSRTEDLSSDGTLPEGRDEGAAGSLELAEALERALDRLPDQYREAITLTKITGLSVNEAAEVLGTTPTAVKLRVHRGYEKLRAALASLESSATFKPERSG